MRKDHKCKSERSNLQPSLSLSLFLSFFLLLSPSVSVWPLRGQTLYFSFLFVLLLLQCLDSLERSDWLEIQFVPLSSSLSLSLSLHLGLTRSFLYFFPLRHVLLLEWNEKWRKEKAVRLVLQWILSLSLSLSLPLILRYDTLSKCVLVVCLPCDFVYTQPHTHF